MESAEDENITENGNKNDETVEDLAEIANPELNFTMDQALTNTDDLSETRDAFEIEMAEVNMNSIKK